MRKTLMALAAVFLLLASSLATVAAQGATPGADSSRSTAGGGVVPAGTAVTIVDTNGQAAATLTVDKVEDPFTGFDPSSPPPRGFHFVAVDVTLFAAGTATVTGNGYFYAVDSDGFAYQQTYVNRTSADGQVTDFSNLSVDAGQVAKGIVFFAVLNNTTITHVIYQTNSQQWITVLDMSAAATAPGTKVSFVDTNGQPAADITVTEVIDPLTDFDPSSPPQRGFEFAAVNVTVTNTGAAPFTISQSDFTVVDVDGFSSPYYGAYRTADATAAKPDLQSGAAIDPGKSVSGIVSFQVLKGSKINQVFYVPSGRIVEVVNLGGKGVVATATPGPQPTATASAEANATEASATDVSATEAPAVATVDLSGIDCKAVDAWGAKLVAAFGVLGPIGADIASWETDPTTIDSAKARADAKTVDDAISGLKDMSVPDAKIQPLADGYLGLLQTYSDGLKSVADHNDAKDILAISADFDKINGATDVFSDPTLTALSDSLTSACPELANLGA